MRKILIIGGGIGGLTTAIALQQKGFDAHVYESAAEVPVAGKGIWVPTNAMQIFERLGLSTAVVREGVSLEHIEVHDKNGGVLFRLDLGQVKMKHGHTIVSIHRAALHRVLVEHIQPGTLHLAKGCTGLTQDDAGVTAQFKDGTQVEGDILVGADGIHSVIRQALFPEVVFRYSGQTCYRGIATMELPASLARTSWEVWGGQCRFGFSAIGPQEVYWFAPRTAPAGSPEREGMLVEHLAECCAGFPAPIPAIIEHTPLDQIIRTDLYDLSPLKSWCKGRVILLGDAAHAMTPNLGQGGAQAIEDAFLLAYKLSNGGSISQAFREYEHMRMPRVRRIVQTAWRYGQIAHIRNRWVQRLRNLAMQSVPGWVNQKQVDWLYTLKY